MESSPFAIDSISVASGASTSTGTGTTTSTSVSTMSHSAAGKDVVSVSTASQVVQQMVVEDDLMIDLLWDDTAPAPAVTADEMDTLVAHQMEALSMQDREKVYHDLYGITPTLTETPQLLEERLQQLEAELELLQNVPAYDMAALLDKDYVTNRDFRLRFLRADLLDAKKAALRLTRHFQVKLDLFGRHLLVRDITQDDLDDKTLAALKSGFSQFLPLRDRSGRLVHCQFVIPPTVDLETKLKMDFYMCMVKSEDIETQRKGCVGIRFYNGQWLQQQQMAKELTVNGHKTNWQAPQLLSAVPIRPSAMHLCHDSKSIWSPVFAVMKYILGSVVRHRTREHYGTHEQCLFQLQTYGIVTTTPTCFPLRDDGTITTEYHKELWRKRHNLERLRAQKQQLEQQLQEAEEEEAIRGSPLLPSLQDDDDDGMTNNQQPASSSTSTTGENEKQNANRETASPISTSTDADESSSNHTDQPTTPSPPLPPTTQLAVSEPEPISIAGQNDVLLGRGKRFYEHAGNIRFRYMVEHVADEYNATTSTSAKKQITANIVARVHAAGGRFLKDDRDAGWVAVDDETARLKVSHVFRNMRLKSNSNSQQGIKRGRDSGGNNKSTVLSKDDESKEAKEDV